ncbi:MAG TPA: vWA domain-containing protein, partial [Planctomycetota bacterium]|nr:vWA domain-containing protein [Planctomycetota bacterium]
EGPKDPDAGLKPPDPDRKSTERREAPSLGLLLLIDASSSMTGQNLRLAQVAAVKAAEVLNAEDRLGVVAFNEGATEVIPMAPADDLPFIRDQISRIQAEGGTDFRAALEAAREVFAAERLQVKHCILLSDGKSAPGRVLTLVRELVKEGVTISTVGVGFQHDVKMLSDIAAEGRGKYQGAPDVTEVPQIFTVEAERIVQQSGARRRGDPPRTPPAPERGAPQPPERSPTAPPAAPDPEVAPPRRKTVPLRRAWPAAYLKGVRPESTPGPFAQHKAEARADAWLALKTEAGEAAFAHRYAGFGRIAASAAPFDGPSAGPLAEWDDYANFLAQTVRFLIPAERPERFLVDVTCDGREIRLRVRDLEESPEPPAGYAVEIRDERGRLLPLAVERLDAGFYRATAPPDDPAALADVRVAARGEPGEGRGAAPLGPHFEIEGRGADLAGLKRWAAALGGEVRATPPDGVDVVPDAHERRVDAPPPWLPWLLAALALDLALKRFRPGEFPATTRGARDGVGRAR